MVRCCVFLVSLLCCASTFGESDRPSCVGDAFPGFALSGANPWVNLIQDKESKQWQPPDCIPWVKKPARFLVSTGGRFYHSGDATTLLSRFAAASSLTDIRYWSVTRQAWKPLFKAAYAVEPGTETRRDDFSIGELTTGSEVYLWQKEAYLPSALVMEMQVLERTPERLVITMANTEPVRWMLTRVIDPGDYEFYYLLEREDESTWRFYNVSRLVGGGLALAFLPDESLINRAVAIFRHFAGYPTDTEPPLAPVRK
ncbi:MAG: DUF6675 family protein [bacterium]